VADHAFLDRLNPEQRRAVTHGPGPLLVIAGAGTGKTNTLAHRVAWLVHEGVPPERLLLLTFTRRAAQAMLDRAQSAARASTGKVWGGTFHAIANRLLRTWGAAAGLSPGFSVMDEGDSADLLGLARSRLGFASKEKRFPRKSTLRAIYSRLVNSRLTLAEVLNREYPWCANAEEGIRALFDDYNRRKQQRQCLDYDDLLLFWNAILEDRAVAAAISARFEHVLVDEYQDTNLVQAQILQRLRADNRNITVVGDDAQSIYSFRAATVRNILDFPAQFPGATVVTLEENYRSTQPILDLSNAVMKPARDRYTKNLRTARKEGERPQLVTCRDEEEQTRIVCDTVLARLEEGIKLRDQAVLFRAGSHSDNLELELARRNIPYHKYGGLRFLEAAHVKDLLAFLRILENPRDEVSWFRALEMFEGVGPRTAERFFADLAGLEFDLARLAEIELPEAARPEFRRLARALAELAGDAVPLTAQVERLREYYSPLLARLHDNPQAREADLAQLAQVAQRYRSRGNFITDLTLDPPDSTSDLAGPPCKDEDWLVLSTIHSAKGCEWKAVYVIHAADGMIPSDMATSDEEGIEEERRLFYVALTRARDRLTILFPLRYYYRKHPLGDSHGYAQLTRYITPAARDCLDSRLAALPELASEARYDRLVQNAEDIRARISDRWRRQL
jgi:DNA helicase-2/ATP-dependent DNA helicase PcrA